MGHGTGVNAAEELPNGVDDILKFLASMARGYDNHLKWNEVAKLKADLMNVPERWLVIDPAVVRSHSLDLGMREEDVDEIVDLITRAKHGRRLIPAKTYRRHAFPHAVTVFPETRASTTSNLIDW